ncbi:hypothetical protein [Paenibacillus aquistagni]|uniref:hypothetical protein n=1 Tax=Paenibacillus aquistagni TaxID=1852522 RepID=UPI001FD40588|nr:hypothetical protein [Paenibacillus aquistagni]
MRKIRLRVITWFEIYWISIIVFMLYLGLSYVDLVVDHLLFHWSAVEEDGRALTLWEKAGELRHDVWETSFIAPVLVLLAIITGRLIRGGRAQSSV